MKKVDNVIGEKAKLHRNKFSKEVADKFDFKGKRLLKIFYFILESLGLEKRRS